MLSTGRLIAAQGLFGHVVARGFKSPGPASAAYLTVFAGTALASEAVEVTQVSENLCVVPYFLERFFSDITAIQVQESAGLNNACVGNETEPDPPQTTAGDSVQTVGFKGHFFSVSFGILP